MDNKIVGNIFADRLNTYQSANSEPKSLVKNFVVRINEFELIVSALEDKKKNDPLQHELLLGRRGSGKSTLLKRIEIEINDKKKLNKKYIPVNFAEEQAGIYRLSDLWYETLQELHRRTDIDLELKAFSEFENDREYTIYLFDEIRELLTKIGKKAVLLLDNIDRVFENFGEDGHLLREVLLNYNNISIIGASTRMDEHFWKYDQPFYQFFRVHHLEALTFEEINTLLNHWSKIMNLPELKDFAVKNRGKIEAIRILTDGLPRTLQFFIRLLLTEKNIYGFQYIKKIMDEATPLYQERLNSLTASQRKIVLEMAFIWEATSTKQLVDKVRMQSKLVSAYLKQLISFGIVEKISTGTKNNLYRISERFFNMWLIVTQGNPDQKRKAKYLTIFIENWYDKNEIKALADKHLTALISKSLKFDKAKVITKALAQSKYTSTQKRDELIENTLLLREEEMTYGDLPKKSTEIIESIYKDIDSNNYSKAIKKAEQIENEDDGVKFGILGYIYNEMNNYSNAEKYYLKAIEHEHFRSMYNLTIQYLETNQKQENALELIYLKNKREPDFISIQLELIVEIWNNIFENVNIKLEHILNQGEGNDLSTLLRFLLYFGQKNLVLSYFESDKYGKELQSKYVLLYYAVLILTDNIGNKKLRIPEEVLPTVENIVKEVKEKNEFYLN